MLLFVQVEDGDTPSWIRGELESASGMYMQVLMCDVTIQLLLLQNKNSSNPKSAFYIVNKQSI
jgi:hypothetical protein